MVGVGDVSCSSILAQTNTILGPTNIYWLVFLLPLQQVSKSKKNGFYWTMSASQAPHLLTSIVHAFNLAFSKTNGQLTLMIPNVNISTSGIWRKKRWKRVVLLKKDVYYMHVNIKTISNHVDIYLYLYTLCMYTYIFLCIIYYTTWFMCALGLTKNDMQHVTK